MKTCANGRMFGKKTSLSLMFLMTSSYFVAEIVVGYITNSTALIADSFHMLSDVLSLVIGFLAVLYSRRNSKYNTYGWVRAEIVGALTNAVFLLALCFTIIVSAVQRLISFEEIKNPLLVLYVGAGGLVINLLGLVMFHGHSHGHHHHDDEDDLTQEIVEALDDNVDIMEEGKPPKKHGGQMNMKGVFLHILGDALGSVVVIISALTINFAEGRWRFYLDPLMSLVIATIIIITTFPLFKRSALILLQHPPSNFDQDDLMNKLMKIQGIYDVHEFHLWQLSGSVLIISAHVIMHDKNDFSKAAKEAKKIFHEKGVHSFTLQPEFYSCSVNQSVCGASNCPYLTANVDSIPNGRLPSEDEESSASQRSTSNSINNSCLLPCVSTQCEKYRCCSTVRDAKALERKENDVPGEPNPCFAETDSTTTASERISKL